MSPTGHRDMRPCTTLRAYLRRMAKQKRLMDGNSKKNKKNAWEYFSKDLKKQTNPKQPFWFQFSEKHPNDENTSLYSVYCIFTQTGGRSALRPL